MNLLKKSNLTSIVIGIICFVALCCLTLGACAQSDSSGSSSKQGTVKIAANIPELPIKDIGLGDLTKKESSAVNPDAGDTEQAQRYTLKSREYYKSENGTKELQVSHYNNVDKVDLETFTEIKAFQFNISYTNYRMGESELMSLVNSKVTDGYYVKSTWVDKNAYVIEQAVFPDGDDFSIISLIFKCEDVCIPGTNIHLQIPIASEVNSYPMPYRHDSKAYTYPDKFELPTIAYYSLDASIEQCLFDYATAYNVDASEYTYNGMHFVVAKELNVDVDGAISNVFSLFIDYNGKTYVVELRESSAAKTYAFSAILNGMYFS